MSKRLFTNSKGAVVAIFVFILLLLFVLGRAAKAEEPSLNVEVGSAIVRGETPSVNLFVNWEDIGPGTIDVETGLTVIGESTFQGNYVDNVFGAYAALSGNYKGLIAGIGVHKWNRDTPYVCDYAIHLKAGWQISSRLSLVWRHTSTGGSCEPNYGRDWLALGWRF